LSENPETVDYSVQKLLIHSATSTNRNRRNSTLSMLTKALSYSDVADTKIHHK